MRIFAPVMNDATFTSDDLDRPISMAKAGKLCPKPVMAITPWRWARKGLRSRSGVLIRLRCNRVGGRVYTTRRWLQDFFDEVAAADAAYFDPSRSSPQVKPTPARIGRQQAIDDARCKSAGF